MENPRSPPQSDDGIAFEQQPDAITPPVDDKGTSKIIESVKTKLEREQIERDMRVTTGQEKPAAPAPVPREIPDMMFKIGAKTIDCPKFELDEDDSKSMAKHLTIIMEDLQLKKWYFSAVIVLLITASKVIACKDAIMAKFSGVKKEKPAAFPAPGASPSLAKSKVD